MLEKYQMYRRKDELKIQLKNGIKNYSSSKRKRKNVLLICGKSQKIIQKSIITVKAYIRMFDSTERKK